MLERYPGLKIIASHGGGHLPAYSGRIDHAWRARSDAHGALPKPPTFYLKQIYLDTIVVIPDQLEALVKLFGVDKIQLGTDYPYDMGEYDPIGHIASRLIHRGGPGGDRRGECEGFVWVVRLRTIC